MSKCKSMELTREIPEDLFRCRVCGISLSADTGICPSCERELIESTPEKIPREKLFSWMSSWDAGKKWGITKRRAAQLCSYGYVTGAFKKSETWYIPIDAPKPADRRRKAGIYFSNGQQKFISARRAAQKWGLSPRYVAKLCADKKIEGVVKDCSSWKLPADAVNPSKRKMRTD